LAELVAIETGLGRLAGVDDGRVLRFSGVPYACAGRWQAPRPTEPWSGVLDASAPGPVAPQSDAAAFPVPAEWVVPVGRPQSEDCLSLNVVTPGVDGARPVLVWVHGGAFLGGGSSARLYDGAELATRGDVVVITINFRLGALGLLAHPALAETDEGAFANWALLDIVQALRWVSANAASFGGDPANVTLFGQSTGSEAILAVLASRAADGLVRRVILQSGPPRARSLEDAAQIAERLAHHLGVGSVAALRDVPATAIVEAQRAVGPRVGLPFLPVIDGRLLDRRVEALLAEGAAAGIPVLAGTTRDEWRWWAPRDPAALELDSDALRGRLAARFGAATDEIINVIRCERAAAGEPADASDVWFAVQTEAVFRVETIRMADALARHTPVHVYLFAWRSPAMDGWLGACHCLEIPFIFGTHHLRGLSAWTGTGPEIARLSESMMDSWLNFARTGQPAGAESSWRTYDPGRRRTLIIAADQTVVEAPFDAERRVVDEHLPH